MKPEQIQEARVAAERMIALGNRKDKQARRKMNDAELKVEFSRVLAEIDASTSRLLAAMERK
ncbi:hypothetical protein ETAA8_28540 [Anatilimnocola aggregata]|uniref:Uncharacterized protein n=1 Tax=Anatilimnocola aggregata TaxID=2528021 RepID=A0A517YC12_9BACT|nr:hypothetical protein [Anatilimnocola aggregata]QDU27764.1 hypothetical protein ETAA8_28540 [Anatilimnocola aggregata]